MKNTNEISGTINTVVVNQVFSAIAREVKVLNKFSRGEMAHQCYAEIISWFGNTVGVERDMEFANAFNGIAVDAVALESVVVGKTRLKLSLPGIMVLKYSKIDIERAKISVMFSFMRSAVALGLLTRKEEVERWRDEKNNLKFRKHYTYSMIKNPRVERNNLRGINFIPGVLGAKSARVKAGSIGAKYNSTTKEFSRRAASKALRVVQLTKDELWELTKDSKEFKEGKIEAEQQFGEGFAKFRERYDTYINQVMAMATKEELFLSNWFDSRFRMYYLLTHPLLNPQGGGANKYLWETAHSYTMTKKGMSDMIWAASVLGKGRRTRKKAVAYWNRYESLVRKSLLAETKKAKLFYNKRLLAAIDAGIGAESNFLVWFDFTSGGIQHASVAFHDTTGLGLSNAGRCDGKVGDPHAANAKHFKLTRDQAKDLMQPTMHGQSEYSFVTSTLPKVGIEGMEPEESNLLLDKAIGKWHRNAKAIANFGKNIYTKENASLVFSAPDGQRCVSSARFKSCTLGYDFIDLNNKNKMGSVSAYTCDLPFATVTIKGKEVPIFNEEADSVTVAGLYANIIHAIDGYTLRQINAYLYVHDNFAFIPGEVQEAIDSSTKVHLEMYDRKYIEEALLEIADHHRDDVLGAIPELTYGHATRDCIAFSDGAFMMP